MDEWSSLTSAEQGFVIGILTVVGVCVLALLILQIVGMWKTFQKAKQPGWAAIVPFYNQFVSIKIAGLELWWFVVILLLFAIGDFAAYGYVVGDEKTSVIVSGGNGALMVGSLVFYGFLNYKIARSFGKGAWFAVGLTLLSPIFWAILGLSRDVKYKGPAGPYKIAYPETPKKAQ
jgi:hypothetical protein